MNIGIIGITGRMGKRVLSCALKKNISIAFGSASSHSPFLGCDLGELIDAPPLNLYVTKLSETPFDQADLLIDFSLPIVTEEVIRKAVHFGKPLVIGTTGYSDATFKLMQEASLKIPLFVAANFSMGLKLCSDVVKTLSKGASSIDIIETHHITKKDTPSGTALMLKKILDNKPSIQSIRQEDHVGEHTIIFTMENERITLTHSSFSRDTFALGALKAATFLLNKPPGLYTQIT